MRGERKEDKDCREIQAADRVPPESRQQTWLTRIAPLPGTALAPETHLQVKGDADHEVPENCQESANQVFLKGHRTEGVALKSTGTRTYVIFSHLSPKQNRNKAHTPLP